MICHDHQTIRVLGAQGLMFKRGLHPEAPTNTPYWNLDWVQNCQQATDLLRLLAASGGRYTFRGCVRKVCGDSYDLGLVEVQFADVWYPLSQDGGEISVSGTGIKTDFLGDVVTTSGIVKPLPLKGRQRFEVIECADSTIDPTGFDYSSDLQRRMVELGIRAQTQNNPHHSKP